MAFTKTGYGQVEPTHLSAQYTGQIYAQLPAKSNITQLENGQFAKYDYANGVVDVASTANGEYMLVFNEVKLYGKTQVYGESYKNFVMTPDQFTDGKMYPRLLKTNVGDIIVTNAIKSAVTGENAGSDIVDKAKLTVGNDGFLVVTASPASGAMVWQIADATIKMPDGSDGAKIVRIN